MLKLLATALLLSSLVQAKSTSEKVEEFLVDRFEENSRLETIDVKVDSIKPVEDLDGWDAYIIDVKATLKSKPKDEIKQKMIFFSNGVMITQELIDMQSGEPIIERIKPDFKSEYYHKENLIYGDKNAKYKVVIFSDPLCPFCKKFVPGAIKDMKKEPKKFAVYYFHFPLTRLHPAALTVVKAAIVAEHKGIKDVVLKMYNIKVDPREKDAKKILEAFNKAVGTDVKLEELKEKYVTEQFKSDQEAARNTMIGGTPTVYINGKIDKTKKKYLKVK
jgi:predicted DsbA family dithiol-disulfide isomerase